MAEVTAEAQGTLSPVPFKTVLDNQGAEDLGYAVSAANAQKGLNVGISRTPDPDNEALLDVELSGLTDQKQIGYLTRVAAAVDAARFTPPAQGETLEDALRRAASDAVGKVWDTELPAATPIDKNLPSVKGV